MKRIETGGKNDLENRLLEFFAENDDLQKKAASFVSRLLNSYLENEDFQQDLVEQLIENKISLIKKQPRTQIRPISPEGRIQVSSKQAALILGYHPKYFARKAEDWGLTKVYMSSRSCRYFLDEIEELQRESSVDA